MSNEHFEQLSHMDVIHALRISLLHAEQRKDVWHDRFLEVCGELETAREKIAALTHERDTLRHDCFKLENTKDELRGRLETFVSRDAGFETEPVLRNPAPTMRATPRESMIIPLESMITPLESMIKSHWWSLACWRKKFGKT